jgi:hypothetical protein
MKDIYNCDIPSRMIIDFSDFEKLSRKVGIEDMRTNISESEENFRSYDQLRLKQLKEMEILMEKYNPVAFLKWALENSIEYMRGEIWWVGIEDRQGFKSLDEVFSHYLETEKNNK